MTDSAALIPIVQVPVPLQAEFPLQPANTEPEAGAAVSVTLVPLEKLAEQPVALPLVQSIPAGLLVTVPVPLPAVVTVSANPVCALQLAFA